MMLVTCNHNCAIAILLTSNVHVLQLAVIWHLQAYVARDDDHCSSNKSLVGAGSQTLIHFDGSKHLIPSVHSCSPHIYLTDVQVLSSISWKAWPEGLDLH